MDEDEQINWEYKSDEGSAVSGKSEDVGTSSAKRPSQKGNDSVVTWVASEYIEHERNTNWYILLALITIGLAVGIYFLTKDIIATIIITVVGIIVGVFAGRKPRQMEYELSASGLRIGEKSYPYSLFRTFSIIRDGAINSINLAPIKRFMPPISAYFAAKDEKRITTMLGNYLPYEERKLDSIDRLSRRLRF
jgi:hypothetical protein